METRLPRSIAIGGTPCPIRWDFCAALDIFEALKDPDFSDQARAYAALHILYRDADRIPAEYGQEAVERCLWYLRGGREPDPPEIKKPRLMDWTQDFPIIVPAVNRVIGYDIRERRRVHWWTVLAAFHEIGGDCLFSQVVGIRSKQAKGKQLDKADQAFYRENKTLIDLHVETTAAEEDLLKIWTGKEG